MLAFSATPWYHHPGEQDMLLPIVITHPGHYYTRCGDIVLIDSIGTYSGGTYEGLRTGYVYGKYHDGTTETWKASGRIYPNKESNNDIVREVGGIDYDLRLRLIREAALKVQGLETMEASGINKAVELRAAREKLALFWNGFISG